MLRFTRILATTSVVVVSSAALVACGQGGSNDETNADGAVVVDFWHSSSGAAGETMEDLVAQFNEEHKGEIEVRATYQGNYEDAISKFIASVQTGDLPAMIQASDVQTAFLKDSDLAVPADELNDKHGGDYDFGNLNEIVSNYYTMEDTVYSMPAMVSQPAIFTNDDVLKEAGVDPSDLETVDGFLDAVDKIHEKTGKAGLSFHQSGWYAEQFAAANNQLWCTPDNGTGTELASSFNIDNQDNVDLWNRLGEMYSTGALFNPGSDGSASSGAFQSGEAAILLNSSSGYGNLIDGTSFNWSARALPSEADDAGAVPGGNSIWAIGEGHNEETQSAAWEFMKFIGSDEVQEKIFTETGYLPTTSSAAESLGDLSPQQESLIKQLTDTPASPVTAGCHTGALNDARSSYTEAMTSIASGTDAAEALKKAQEGANASIESYSKRAKN